MKTETNKRICGNQQNLCHRRAKEIYLKTTYIFELNYYKN